jgi:hypothetical protein
LQKTSQRKEPPNRQKIAQSGHPGFSQENFPGSSLLILENPRKMNFPLQPMFQNKLLRRFYGAQHFLNFNVKNEPNKNVSLKIRVARFLIPKREKYTK